MSRLLPPRRWKKILVCSTSCTKDQPPVFVQTATAVHEIPVSTATISPLVSKISDIEKTEYRVEVLNADHPAWAARLTDPEHLEKLRTMFRVSRWVSDFSSFAVAEKNPPSDCLSVPPPGVDGMLAGPLYLVNSFLRRVTSRTVYDSGTD